MQIDVGYFYFIKDSFFDIIDDSELMKNKENGNKRPCYYCIKSKKYDNIIWFIPVSTKIDKYKRIYDSSEKIPLLILLFLEMLQIHIVHF